MLKSFLGKSLGLGDAKKQPAEGHAPQGKLDLDRLKLLFEFFPIGKKLHYYPEFMKEIMLDTVIVGYCVNGDFVYSGEGIVRDAQGYPNMFYAAENKAGIAVSKVHSFQLIVPDTTSLEMKLDYTRRAMIGRGRQFVKGNNISLMSVAGAKGVASLDTEVAKRQVLQDGPYANNEMILLTPELGTLSVTDQRSQARTKINVPASVFLQKQQLACLCTIIDVSENAVRVRLHGIDKSVPPLQKNDEIIIDINLGESERRYIIKGGVIASRAQDICVIQLQGLFKDGKLSNFEPLDRLELKAGLLSYA